MMLAGPLCGAALAAAGDVNLALTEAQDGVLAVLTWVDRAACAEERAITTALDIKGSFQVFATGTHGGGLDVAHAVCCRVRVFTVAKGDSIGLVVRRCTQCSAGKSKKASSLS